MTPVLYKMIIRCARDYLRQFNISGLIAQYLYRNVHVKPEIIRTICDFNLDTHRLEEELRKFGCNQLFKYSTNYPMLRKSWSAKCLSLASMCKSQHSTPWLKSFCFTISYKTCKLILFSLFSIFNTYDSILNLWTFAT